MASLAIGLAGGYLFGPVGFLVGSLVGNLLFPQKIDGPRLTNLKPQDSRYGEMIQLLYGTMRLSGQMIWTTDLKEHSHKTGGKGGPEITTFTYSASFAVKICKGPVAGLRRIWANGTIVWDGTGQSSVDNTQVPLTFYKGIETDNPDPTMEGVLGVGNVPAFRDDCAAVFTNWDFGQFGNTWPSLSFEVVSAVGPIPNRVSTWTVPASRFITGYTISAVPNGSNIDIVQYALTSGQTQGTYRVDTYDYQGNHLGTPANSVFPTLNGGNTNVVLASPNSYIAFTRQGGVGTPATSGGWYAAGVLVAGSVIGPTENGVYAVDSAPMYFNNNVYAMSGDGHLTRWPAPNGIPTSTFDKSYAMPNSPPVWSDGHGGVWIAIGDDGNIWVAAPDNLNTSFTALYKFDKDLNLLFTWHSQQSLTPPYIPANLNNAGSGGGGNVSFTIWGGNELGSASIGGHQNVYAYTLSGTTWNQDANLLPANVVLNGGQNAVSLGNGFAVVADGIVSLIPPVNGITLASIVANISQRIGLIGANDYNVSQFGDYDVSQLSPMVPGYLISTRTDARTDLTQLMTAYFFDAVEENGIIKFVVRGQQPLLTIPDNDLAAQQISDKPPALIQVKRGQTIDLPTQVNINFVDINAEYQKGTQEARRMATLPFTDSGGPSTVDLAIGMSTTKARQVANVALFGTWIERNIFVFWVSRKYEYLEPTDVITVHGYTLRITKKTEKVVGIVEFEGVESVPSIYIQQQNSSGGSGGGSPGGGGSQVLQMLLLDLPLISDTDNSIGVYAALTNTTGTFNGASIYESSDNINYTLLSSTSVGAVIGSTSDALGDFFSGNTFDEFNTTTVVIGTGGGTLASVTDNDLLNYANMCVIGQEVLQFRTASLISASTYKLSGLLRGRRGTEWATGTHQSGESFALLPVLDVPLTLADIDQTRYYKAVPAGQTVISGITPVTFACVGNRLKCYSPAQLGGGEFNGSGDVNLSWNRRTRVGGQWVNNTDVPLSEATEQYIIQIWDSTYTVCARQITANVDFAVYTGAQQTTDFGALQQTIYFTVGQVGQLGIGAQSRGTAPGIGGSNGIPSNPITPISWNPIVQPPPAPGGGGSLPINHSFVYAGDTVILTMTAGQIWVGKFTTGGGTPSGHCAISEYPSPVVMRHMYIATDSGGLNKVAKSDSYGTTATAFWGPGSATLAATTTYYIIINNLAPDGSQLEVIGTVMPSVIFFAGL